MSGSPYVCPVLHTEASTGKGQRAGDKSEARTQTTETPTETIEASTETNEA